VSTIVLFGVKGSGKDTVGDILVANHGYAKDSFAAPIKQMVRIAFPKLTDEDLFGPSEKRERQEPSYPIGGVCLSCGMGMGALRRPDGVEPIGGHYPWACTRLLNDGTYCPTEYPPYLNARIALQTLGTEWGRRLYRNVWVDSAFERIADRAYAYEVAAQIEPFPTPAPPVVITDGRFRNELWRSKELGAFCVKLTRGLAESTSMHPSEQEFREIPDSAFDSILDNANIPLDRMDEAVSRMLAYMNAGPHVQE